jgi:hypothetical protein
MLTMSLQPKDPAMSHTIQTQFDPTDSPVANGDTLENGFKVVSVETLERVSDTATGDVRSELSYVLAAGSADMMHPYATWAMDKNGNTYWGHYFSSMFEATKDYVERVDTFKGNR